MRKKEERMDGRKRRREERREGRKEDRKEGVGRSGSWEEGSEEGN